MFIYFMSLRYFDFNILLSPSEYVILLTQAVGHLQQPSPDIQSDQFCRTWDHLLSDISTPYIIVTLTLTDQLSPTYLHPCLKCYTYCPLRTHFLFYSVFYKMKFLYNHIMFTLRTYAIPIYSLNPIDVTQLSLYSKLL